MGIYIYGEIAPTRISKPAWEKTYEDTLKIVRYGQLAECEYKIINGQKTCVSYTDAISSKTVVDTTWSYSTYLAGYERTGNTKQVTE